MWLMSYLFYYCVFLGFQIALDILPVIKSNISAIAIVIANDTIRKMYLCLPDNP